MIGSRRTIAEVQRRLLLYVKRSQKMKREIFRLLQVLLAISASQCFAGGTMNAEELKQLIGQKPAIGEALAYSFELSDSAYAEIRLGSHFKYLGGARVGPYTIQATLKTSHKRIFVILCTKARFLDDRGVELQPGKEEYAQGIDEKLISVVLVEPPAVSAGLVCPSN